ncbi:MAG: hypothetical protein IJ829_01275, partial [Kiritimatiellae bacterium]|nr:hypothetical protein [Kiritimatiellia bacterium]
MRCRLASLLAAVALLPAALYADSSANASGGSVSLVNNGLEAVHSFSAAGEYTFTLDSAQTVRLLLVGGGGSGGHDCSGGGGAGGMIDTNDVELAAGVYTVTVGAGGAETSSSGAGNDGGDTIIVGPDGTELYRAYGGGGGGGWGSTAGRAGGSGGGGCNNG